MSGRIAGFLAAITVVFMALAAHAVVTSYTNETFFEEGGIEKEGHAREDSINFGHLLFVCL